MTDYTELVKALNRLWQVQDNDLEDWVYGSQQAMHDAADAIVALGLDNEDYEHENRRLHGEIEALQAEVKRMEPKRGEWIYHPKDAIEMMFTLPKCSICGHESSDALNYCPNCGAKMNESNASNALNALDNAQDGPIITPCLGCSDYDGYGGCKSKGGCARKKTEVHE